MLTERAIVHTKLREPVVVEQPSGVTISVLEYIRKFGPATEAEVRAIGGFGTTGSAQRLLKTLVENGELYLAGHRHVAHDRMRYPTTKTARVYDIAVHEGARQGRLALFPKRVCGYHA